MIRFTDEIDGYKKGQKAELGAGVEDAYVRFRKAAVFVNPDGSETDGDGKDSCACSHCDGTGREKPKAKQSPLLDDAAQHAAKSLRRRWTG